jgi:TRAP transporter TAXI family solute receptor
LSACSGEGGPARFYSLGTAGTGGIYYPLGGALASRLSLQDSLGRFTAEVTGGAVENVNRIMSGEMDMAFATANTIYQAYHGVADFEGQGSDALRILAPLYPNRIHVLVNRSSDAQSVADFAGLRVSVGAAGSGTEQSSREILVAFGLTYEDVDVRYLSFSESAAALRDGSVDAAFMSVGYPAGAVLEATTTGGARILPLAGPAADQLREQYPYYEASVIPGGVYPGVEADLPTVAVINWVLSRDDLDPAVARAVLNVLRADRVSLEQVHEMARQIDLSVLDRAPIPLHSALEGASADGGAPGT